MAYDTDRFNGKGLNKSIDFVNSFANKIVGYKCSNQFEVDKILEKLGD